MTLAVARVAAIVSLLLLVLAGCSTVPETPTGTSSASPPPGFAPWTARGKMAFVTADRAETVSFIWIRESAGNERIRLSGIFGLGAVEIERENADVRWIDAGQPRPLRALPLDEDARQLLAELPYANLGDWMIGAAAPVDDSWQLDVQDWQVREPWRIPRRIKLVREGAGLRVVINRWTTP